MSSTTINTNLPRAMASTSPSPTSAPRPSRFTEGCPLTGDEVRSQDDSYVSFLSTVLSEMDEHERRRQRSHRDSASSTDSFLSSLSNSFSPPRENRRSITFSSKRSVELVRQSFDEMRHGSGNGNGDDKPRGGFKGRLRALTGGRERNGSVKAYAGT